MRFNDGDGYALVNAHPVLDEQDQQVGALALLTPITDRYLGYLSKKLTADLALRVNGKFVAASPDHPARELAAQSQSAVMKEAGKKLFALPHYLSEHNRKTIMWDVEPDSAGTPTAQQIEQETLNLTKPGSIILLHPMYQGRDQTRQALKPIIGKLKERGYRFVTVSALLGQA